MLDRPLRARLAPGLDRLAGGFDRLGLAPVQLTGLALVSGLGACVAIARQATILALALWLVNRALDGLDGPLARRRGADELGGLLDFVADFIVYSGFVVGVGVGHPAARVACLFLLASYLVNNVALLSLSSLSERLALPATDERSLRLTTGLAEGGETIAVYVLFCLVPAASTTIAWVFAAAVAITAVQRVLEARSVLRSDGADQAERSASRHRDA